MYGKNNEGKQECLLQGILKNKMSTQHALGNCGKLRTEDYLY